MKYWSDKSFHVSNIFERWWRRSETGHCTVMRWPRKNFDFYHLKVFKVAERYAKQGH